jgi:hypothetical protein
MTLFTPRCGLLTYTIEAQTLQILGHTSTPLSTVSTVVSMILLWAELYFGTDIGALRRLCPRASILSRTTFRLETPHERSRYSQHVHYNHKRLKWQLGRYTIASRDEFGFLRTNGATVGRRCVDCRCDVHVLHNADETISTTAQHRG